MFHLFFFFFADYAEFLILEYLRNQQEINLFKNSIIGTYHNQIKRHFNTVF